MFFIATTTKSITRLRLCCYKINLVNKQYKIIIVIVIAMNPIIFFSVAGYLTLFYFLKIMLKHKTGRNLRPTHSPTPSIDRLKHHRKIKLLKPTPTPTTISPTTNAPTTISPTTNAPTTISPTIIY